MYPLPLPTFTARLLSIHTVEGESPSCSFRITVDPKSTPAVAALSISYTALNISFISLIRAFPKKPATHYPRFPIHPNIRSFNFGASSSNASRRNGRGFIPRIVTFFTGWDAPGQTNARLFLGKVVYGRAFGP